jgi:hypothetical protein
MAQPELRYRFTCEAAPVQAEGTVDGQPFYFRARHENWRFAISEHNGISPVDIDTPDKGKRFGFFIEERYGNEPFAASWMPREEAEAIIRECAVQYRRERAA